MQTGNPIKILLYFVYFNHIYIRVNFKYINLMCILPYIKRVARMYAYWLLA